MLGELLQKYKKLFIALLVVVLVFIGFQFFKGNTDTSGLTSQPVAGVVPEEGGDLISLLLELKSIKLDTSILQNPVFLTLQDFSVELASEPVGRLNPFAPIGVGASPAGSATETAEEEVAQ